MKKSIKKKCLNIIDNISSIIENVEKKTIKGLTCLLLITLLLSWGIIPSLIFSVLNIDAKTLSDSTKVIISFINDLLFLTLLIRIYYKTLKNDFKDYFNKHFIKNIKLSIKYWIFGLTIMFISNFIIAIVMNGQIAQNEEAVRDFIDMAPIYMAFQLAIYAPLTEELIFRKSIKDFISNKYLFAIISGLIFGGLHALSSINSLASLLYLIPYCSLGIVFGLLYGKTNNIFSTISIHAIHNSLALILYLGVL